MDRDDEERSLSRRSRESTDVLGNAPTSGIPTGDVIQVDMTRLAGVLGERTFSAPKINRIRRKESVSHSSEFRVWAFSGELSAVQAVVFSLDYFLKLCLPSPLAGVS